MIDIIHAKNLKQPDTSWMLNECYLFTVTIPVIILTLPKMSHGMF